MSRSGAVPTLAALGPHGVAARFAPEVVEALASAGAAVQDLAAGAELRLCRVRLAQVLGDEDVAAALAADGSLPRSQADSLDEWWTSSAFTEHERACLAFTEQFALSVSAVTQDDVDTLRGHQTDDDVYQFVMALYVLDMSLRANRVLGDLLGPLAEGAADVPGGADD